jgi:hypothetical protein
MSAGVKAVVEKILSFSRFGRHTEIQLMVMDRMPLKPVALRTQPRQHNLLQ